MHRRLRPLAVLLLVGCSVGTGDRDGGGGGGFDAAGGTDAGGGAVDAARPSDDGGPTSRDGGDLTPRDGGPERARECAAEERCDDGVDADCDGRVDEGCACAPGETRSCFTGDPANRERGACADGSMVCVGAVEFGEWGPCEGDTTASAEVCDAAGIDEDCDGAPNDGCECSDGDPDLPCGTDTGECEAGIQRCVDGVRSDCVGIVGPVIETCNALDDDCDGRVDEAIARACGIDEGICRRGSERCEAGTFGACTGGAEPTLEHCDGLDEDCDGVVDEDVTRTCGTDEGRCVAGLEACAGGVFASCEGRVDPIDETCNDVDDDCDGAIDEGLVRSCGSDVGACVAGTETCAAGAWGSCVGSTGSAAETCDGALDEDCDGALDEGCACVDDTTRPCGTDVGACDFGTQRCVAGGWASCVGGTTPGTEACDGALDEDCDGRLDEGCDCVTGATRGCGSDVGECAPGTETCNAAGRWGPCAGATGPVAEVCNMRDDDCDGGVDEADVCPRFPPTVSCPADASALVGSVVTLSGSGSDPDGGAVRFAWSVVVRPATSSATPTPADAATARFTPDVAGRYTLRFCVTDDEAETRCCTVNVDATPACTPPAAPTLATCPTSWDRRPIVTFDPLPSGVTYELFLDGGPAAYALVSMVGQNYHRPASALAPGAAPPGTGHEISARACLASDPSCCSASGVVSARLIESCTTPVAASPSNLVFSEYVTNGDGACSGPDPHCEAGEAIEITNLSHCPVALDGHHFGYCNPSSCGAFRWMNFGPDDVIPPRGVYVAIRDRANSMCAYPFFGPNDPGLFGLRISTLAMEGSNLASGWFNNSGGGLSEMRIATGPWTSISGGTTLELVAPYSGAAGECEAVGFDAVGECGEISPLATPSEVLAPNQLGRLWHPCDAVTAPVPASCM